MAKKASATEPKQKMSDRKAAGLAIAPGRIRKMMRDHTGKRIGKATAVYMTAIVQHIAGELVRSGADSVKKGGKTVDMKALARVVRDDKDLRALAGKTGSIHTGSVTRRKRGAGRKQKAAAAAAEEDDE